MSSLVRITDNAAVSHSATAVMMSVAVRMSGSEGIWQHHSRLSELLLGRLRCFIQDVKEKKNNATQKII